MNQFAVASHAMTPIEEVRPRAPGRFHLDTPETDAGRTLSVPTIAVASKLVTPTKILRPRAPGQLPADTQGRRAGRTFPLVRHRE